jgi:hypothetical protein
MHRRSQAFDQGVDFFCGFMAQIAFRALSLLNEKEDAERG